MSIRFRQRLENFERAMNLLEEALSIPNPSVTERAGIVQFFEMSIELGWKVLKDYLESEGLNPKLPKETIRVSVEAGLIPESEDWMRALTDRNMSSHLYEETVVRSIELKIRHVYFPLLDGLLKTLLSKT
jgi:nucleotidyltransferase substrate binding protein (TIGR01987 family)